MSDLPPDTAAGFEIQPRLNEEMEYFKEMALQETEKWIELVTKKRFKYPEDPRRSLQDGILLCELVNALKPGSVRRINRLPTPIAFLDNLTVFQNACRYEFGLQECQLFDIKDLEDLSLRGVLESEEEIQIETSRRLKNVAITIFWLGKAVRRWYKGPVLDFSTFTDIIDMSHSSQASFRTPSEASFVSSSAGRGFSTDRYLLPKVGSKQTDLAYERVAKYLESKPAYGYQTSCDYQDPVSKSSAQRGEVFQRPGSDFEEEYFGSSVDSGEMYRPMKVSPNQMVPQPARDGNIQKPSSAVFRTRANGTLDLSLKSHMSDTSHIVRNEPLGYREGNFDPRTSSPECLADQRGRARLTLGSQIAQTDGLRSPTSPGARVSLDPLQFVKGDSSILAENAKQTMQLLQQQQQQPQLHHEVRQMTTQEDDDWETKLSDWKSRRRSQTKSQTTSEADEVAADNRVGVKSDDPLKYKEKQSSTVPQASSEITTGPTSPGRTVIKKREQEEDMLALFGFTKIPEKPARKPKVAKKSSEDQVQRDSVDQWKGNQDQQTQQKESEIQKFDEWIKAKHSSPQQPDAVSSAVAPGSETCFHKSNSATEVASDVGEQRRRYLEKVIKISQRPKHHKGFGFTIRGGKEYGMPITVDKVHLGGAADVCDLMSKDEIVAINGAQLANHYLESVRAVIDQAVHCGQVELTIRRSLNDRSFDESESEVFAEEDLVFDEDQNEDETESKLLQMSELKNPRSVTPVPPDDEPPPLPVAPPPLPNWSTFPASQTAFCPTGDIQFFDDDEPRSHEDIPQKDIIMSKTTPLIVAQEGGLHQRTGSDRSTAEVETTVPVQRSEPEKYDMLMKRIHFFGLKPEDSEEYRRTMEEKTLKQARPELLNIPRSSCSSSTVQSSVVQSDERMFAVVVKPCQATPSSSHQPSSLAQPTSSSAPVSHQPPTAATSSSTSFGIEQQNARIEEHKVVRTVGKVETSSRVEERKNFRIKQLSPSVDRERYFSEYGKSDLGPKDSNNVLLSVETKDTAATEMEGKSDDRIEPRNQLPLTMQDDQTKPSKDTNDVTEILSETKSTPKEEQQNIEVRLREKPKDADESDRDQRHSENFSQPFEKSKGWKSLEMLRSFSVSDAVRIDPMERAKEDYLSLMMAQPKLNLEQINRQYFDRDSDRKKMEEWHKKQEQLLKEKFDRDQEELRLKHETALKEASALEKEKQKQEEQMLEKEIIWKHQLEEIQQQREKELEKMQVEAQQHQRMSVEKVERSRHRLERESERRASELLELTGHSQSLLKDSGENPLEQSSSGDAVQKRDDLKVGKVEVQFIDTAQTRANLELLPDSVHASSESLASSTQLEFCPGESANGRNIETIGEREQGTFPTNAVSVEPKAHETRECGENLSEEQPDRGPRVTYSSNPVMDSKPILRDKPRPDIDRFQNASIAAQKERPERSAEAELSAQLIRDEALLISRRAGGGSQWVNTDPEDYWQMSKPEPVICQSVPMNPSPLPSSNLFLLQPQQQQQQQPWNRRLLQDISAPPKHRLQDSESWIIARQNSNEVEEVRWSQEVERQLGPMAIRAPSGKPSVPMRTDSLKQDSQRSPVAPLSQATGLGSAPSVGAKQPVITSSGPPDDLQITSLRQAGHPRVASGSPQGNLSPTAPQKWPGAMVQLKPDSFGAPGIEYSTHPSYNNQARGGLDQLPRRPTVVSDPVVFQRCSAATSTAGTQLPEACPRSYELPLRSASYSVPQPSSSRPYSCDLSQFSSLGSAPGAIPYQHNLHDPASHEPTSEAISMLFNYHRNLPKDDAALGLTFGQSQVWESPTDLSKTSTSDGGQKCADCDKELGFGRCIVLDSLDYCFHPGCFKCSVCRSQLRSQSLRDDFRILASKLHCRNCYTSEQEGLKYSKV